jgi:hypothetical protein
MPPASGASLLGLHREERAVSGFDCRFLAKPTAWLT